MTRALCSKPLQRRLTTSSTQQPTFLRHCTTLGKSTFSLHATRLDSTHFLCTRSLVFNKCSAERFQDSNVRPSVPPLPVNGCSAGAGADMAAGFVFDALIQWFQKSSARVAEGLELIDEDAGN